MPHAAEIRASDDPVSGLRQVPQFAAVGIGALLAQTRASAARSSNLFEYRPAVSAMLHVGRVLQLAAVLLVLAACASGEVRIESNSAADLSAVRFYSMLGGNSLGQRDLLADAGRRRRIEAMIRKQLAAKGLQETSANRHADVLVQYWVDLEVEVIALPAAGAAQSFESPAPPLSEIPSFAAGFSSDPAAATATLREGTLMVDFLEPVRRGLLWRAIVKRPIPRDSAKALAAMEQGLAKALNNFPPRRK
jgi:uncharacterized protein DUF4136